MADSFCSFRGWRGRAIKPGWHNFGVAMLAPFRPRSVLALSRPQSRKGPRHSRRGHRRVRAGPGRMGAVTIVPELARRTSLRWLAYQVDYRLTREGIVYLGGVFVLILAAVNTGNNLLFMILACCLAGILISGIFSRFVLTGIDLKFDLPEHIFAEQPVLAEIELRNEKQRGLRFRCSSSAKAEKQRDEQILTRPVFFPYIPRLGSCTSESGASLPAPRHLSPGCLRHPHPFPLRLLRKNAPCSFGSRNRRLPRVEPTEQFDEVLPLLSGEIASLLPRPRPRTPFSARLPDHRQRALSSTGRSRRETGR